MTPSHAGGYIADSRVRAIEWLPWVLAVLCFFVAPTYLPLGSYILIMIMFALSLDLILGYGGIITLGHSAYFGTGAYAAGIFAVFRLPCNRRGLICPMTPSSIGSRRPRRY